MPTYFLKVLEKWTCKNSTHIECVSPSNMSMGIEEKLFERYIVLGRLLGKPAVLEIYGKNGKRLYGCLK